MSEGYLGLLLYLQFSVNWELSQKKKKVDVGDWEWKRKKEKRIWRLRTLNSGGVQKDKYELKGQELSDMSTSNLKD